MAFTEQLSIWKYRAFIIDMETLLRLRNKERGQQRRTSSIVVLRLKHEAIVLDRHSCVNMFGISAFRRDRLPFH